MTAPSTSWIRIICANISMLSTSPNAAFVNAELLYVRNTYFTFNPVSREGICICLQLQAKQMATAIKNNVAVHFWKRQWFCLKTQHPDWPKEELRALQQRIYDFREL